MPWLSLRKFCFGFLFAASLQATPTENFPVQSRELPLDSGQVESEINPWRLAAVSTVSLSSFAASYFFILKKAWWTEQGRDFHFSNDFDYALNLDKAGHFFGGLVAAEAFHDGLRWSGVPEFQSYLYSAGLSATLQVGIDMKDAYSPHWGYSPWDVGAGIVGAFMPMAERYVPGMSALDFKWSYWKNSNVYFEKSHVDFIGDDFVNQTYWLSLKFNQVLPGPVERFWPDFLALAAGLSVDEGLYTGEFTKGNREIFLSLDWDIESLNPLRNRTTWKRFFHYLNYVKLPSPTWQVYPKRQFLWIYPIHFQSP